MSDAAAHDWWISPEEYLAGEETAETKHEYVHGRVYAMAGATNAHNRIAENIFFELATKLRGTACCPQIFDTKVRVRMLDHQRFYYPDVMVVRRENGPRGTFQDEPAVIFEVLSPSTERSDDEGKRAAYYTVPTLEAYVLVESEHYGATVYRRTEGGWRKELLRLPTEAVELPKIDCSVTLAAIYGGAGL